MIGDGILHGILRRSVAWWTNGLGGPGEVLGRPVRRGGVWSGLWINYIYGRGVEQGWGVVVCFAHQSVSVLPLRLPVQYPPTTESSGQVA